MNLATQIDNAFHIDKRQKLTSFAKEEGRFKVLKT